ncbi:MAG: hypothetical protein ACERLM_10015, partial [Acidimicrobiales bacterium]
MRRALLALGAALMIMTPTTGASAAPAQDVRIITDDVAEFGVFIEEGVEDAYGVTVDVAAIDQAVADVRGSGQDGGLVILSDDASNHASLETFAEAVFQELGQRGAAVDTLVVVTPDQTLAVTDTMSSASMDAALDASSNDLLAGDFVVGYETFFADVEPADTPATPTEPAETTVAKDDSGGSIGWFLPALLIGGLCLIGFLFW